MRFNRVIVGIFLIAACKTTQVTSTGEYREDLSMYRLDLPGVESQGETAEITEVIDNSIATYHSGEITKELDTVNELIRQANQKQKLWDGYVIQVYRGDSRNDAYNIQSELNETYPELKAEVSYFQPTYRVKAGQFFDRLEATRVFNQLKEVYPRALLLPEKLPLPQPE